MDGTTQYFSFLLRPEGVLGQGAFGGWFGVSLRAASDIFIGRPSFQSVYVIERNGGAGQIQTTKTTVVGETTFLVLRADFLAGNDNLRLYINSLPGAAEPQTASAVMTSTDLGLVTSLVVTGPGAFSFDEFRAGPTFASVAPQLQFYRGDVSLDNHVAEPDIPAILTALSDLNKFRTQFNISAAQQLSIADVDNDGKITNADINALIGLLRNGGGSMAAVPEPDALHLILIAVSIGGVAAGTIKLGR